ncbi:hypothetical protein JCM17823_05070 [Halorubrum gandharaense]
MNAKKIVERAKGDVDQKLLEGTGTGGVLTAGYFADGPLVDHLDSTEQVEYALQNLTKGFVIGDENTKETVSPDTSFRTALLVTDVRLLFVVGKDGGDVTFSVPLEDCYDVEISTGILKNRITVHTTSNTYDMYVQKGTDVETVADYINNGSASASQTTESDANRREKRKESAASASIETTPEDTPDSESHEADRETTNGGVDDNPVDEDTGDEGDRTPVRETGAVSDNGSPESPAKSESTIEVLVSDANEQPISGASVELAGSVFDVDASTSQAGRCSVTLPVSSGTVDMTIDHPDYRPTEAEVEVTNGAVIDVALEHIDDGGGESSDSSSPSSDKESSANAGSNDTEQTRENLLKELVELDERNSRRVTRGRMRTDGKFEPEDYEDEFGSWSDALEEVKFDEEESNEGTSTGRSQQEAYTKKQVLNAIADAIDHLDERPNTMEMQKYGEMSPSPAYRYFDTWDDAVSAALDAHDVLAGENEVTEEVDREKNEVTEEVDREKNEVTEEVDREKNEVTEEVDREKNEVTEEVDREKNEVTEEVDREKNEVTEEVDREKNEVTGEREAPNEAKSEPEAPSDTDFEWGESIADPLAGNLVDVPEGRLSDVIAGIVQEQNPPGSKRDALLRVETAAADRLNFTIWKKHDVDFDFGTGDTIRLDEVRLKRWETDDGYDHELSSTKDLSVTLVDGDLPYADSESEPEAGANESGEDAAQRLVGIGGATKSDAEALVDAGYLTTDDLKAASLEELRSISGLDDGTALRMKAEFG